MTNNPFLPIELHYAKDSIYWHEKVACFVVINNAYTDFNKEMLEVEVYLIELTHVNIKTEKFKQNSSFTKLIKNSVAKELYYTKISV